MKIIQIENGKNTAKKLLKENRNGFQAMNKDKLKELGHNNGKKNHFNLNTTESHRKSRESFKKRYENDPDFREKIKKALTNNFKKYNDKLKSGEIKITEKQRKARRLNALRNTYNRFNKDKYDSFEDYFESKQSLHNHKIISIEECGYADVYDITVEKYHNFAIDGEVFVHNCATSFNDDKGVIGFKNSWGNWGKEGYGFISYNYINRYMWDAWTIKDIQVTKEMLKGSVSLI